MDDEMKKMVDAVTASSSALAAAAPRFGAAMETTQGLLKRAFAGEAITPGAWTAVADELDASTEAFGPAWQASPAEVRDFGAACLSKTVEQVDALIADARKLVGQVRDAIGLGVAQTEQTNRMLRKGKSGGDA